MIGFYFSFFCYLAAAALLGKSYFGKNEARPGGQKIIIILLVFALIFHAVHLIELPHPDGVIFGLANSVSFIAWGVALLLFVLGFFKKTYQAVGMMVYPLAAAAVLFRAIFPDTDDKIVAYEIALHILLSALAYAFLALALCQSILLTIQEKRLHRKIIDRFIRKIPPLQTMEKILLQSIFAGFIFLSLSLVSGAIFIEDLLAQHLVHKTTLTIVAWLIFAILLIGHKIVGWQSARIKTLTQVGFGFLVVAYFGSKFVLERLLG